MTTPTPTTVQVKIQLRRDTAATWASVNPVLLAGEAGLETDTNKIKIGNGSTAWNSLGYFPFVVNGGTVTGNLEIGTTGTLTFEGSSADNFETTLGVVNPTADRTINLPNVSGTIITTGDSGTVTSTMIADGTIVDADVSATAEIAVSKLADGAARQLLQTDAAGTGVEWTSNIDIPGTLDVTGAATFDAAVTVTGDLTVNGTTTTISTQNLLVEDKNIIIGDVATPTDTTADGGGITLKGATDKTINWIDATDAWTSSERFSIPLGSAAAPSLTFTGDPNTGIYSPGADQVAISTSGAQRVFVSSGGNVGIGPSTSLGARMDVNTASTDSCVIRARNDTTSVYLDANNGYAYLNAFSNHPLLIGTNNLERLRITSAGLVGIGVSAPSSKLYVSEPNTTAPSLTYGASAAFTMLGGNVELAGGLSGATPFPYWLQARDSTSAARSLVVNPLGGNVGIGTTSPAYKLDVSGSGTQFIRVLTTDTSGFAVGAFRAEYLGGGGGTSTSVELRAGDTYSYLLTTTNHPILFGTNSTERARIDSSGRLGIGTSTPNSKLSVIDGAVECNQFFYNAISSGLATASRGLLFNVDGTSYGRIYAPNGKSVAIQAGAGTLTDAVTVDQSGRVGIGTTSPTSTLTSNGTVHITGAGTPASGAGLEIGYGSAAASTTSLISYNRTGSAWLDADYRSLTHQFFTSGSERARIDSSGRLLVGASSDSGGALLQVNGNRIRVATAKTPASATDTGTTGEICWDASYIYVCTATNTWKRTAISTW